MENKILEVLAYTKINSYLENSFFELDLVTPKLVKTFEKEIFDSVYDIMATNLSNNLELKNLLEHFNSLDVLDMIYLNILEDNEELKQLYQLSNLLISDNDIENIIKPILEANNIVLYRGYLTLNTNKNRLMILSEKTKSKQLVL